MKIKQMLIISAYVLLVTSLIWVGKTLVPEQSQTQILVADCGDPANPTTGPAE